MNLSKGFFFILRSETLCNIDFPTFNSSQWEAIFALSEKQSVTGVVFQGINKLPKEKQPPKDIAMKWFARYMQIKKANTLIYKDAIEFCNLLFENGFRCCILKGQGNAILYNDIYSRMPGDIDIWVDADRKTIVDFVNRNFKSDGMRFHHIGFLYKNKVSVELHFLPLYVNNPIYNRRLKNGLRNVLMNNVIIG